jgi:hypothetical protein
MRAWLKDHDWEAITEINEGICAKANCLHKKNSAKGNRVENLWKENHTVKMTLEDGIMFCKRIHFAEPFINMNGNTMAAVALASTKKLTPKTCTKVELDNAICAIVAGTDQGVEAIIVRNESRTIDPPTGPEFV